MITLWSCFVHHVAVGAVTSPRGKSPLSPRGRSPINRREPSIRGTTNSETQPQPPSQPNNATATKQVDLSKGNIVKRKDSSAISAAIRLG